VRCAGVPETGGLAIDLADLPYQLALLRRPCHGA
jgi:hypothetical protein